MGIDYREVILAFVKRNGYAFPSDVMKELKKDSMISSAMLSEMASRGMVKISSLKVGSSPVYYDPQNPGILERFVDSLKRPEQEVIALLKSSSILRDNTLSPLARVALRSVKDFAIPLDVTIGEEKEVFWRWFLLSDVDAERAIRLLLDPPVVESPPEILEVSPEVKKARARKVKESQKVLPAIVKPVIPALSSSESSSEIVAEKKEKKDPATKSSEKMGGFASAVRSFFSSQNIEVTDWNVVKEGKEFDIVIRVPSPVGPVLMYCRAKDKKKILDADLSSAVVDGQVRRLPVLFLTSGTLGKDGDSLLEKKFKGLTFKTL